MAGFANARDVGGMPTGDGHHLRSGVLYRSDAPKVGDSPPVGLTPWPPHTVLDFRSHEESAEAHPMSADVVSVVNLSLLSEANLVAAGEQPKGPPDLLTLYSDLLTRSAHLVVESVELIADAPGPVLIHCAAGKDRTGVVIATVLSALGVAREDIVADYIKTEPNMAAVLARMVPDRGDNRYVELRAKVMRNMGELMTAPAHAIESVLDFFDAQPGGASGWLVDHGVSEGTIERLRERLVAD